MRCEGLNTIKISGCLQTRCSVHLLKGSRNLRALDLLLLITVLLGALISVPNVKAARPVINSQWTETPPTIDGRFTEGEWSNLQIHMTAPSYQIEAFVYFLNDNSNLYVLVDAVGDQTNSAMDECLLVFGFQDQVKVEVIGLSGLPSTDGFTGAIGYGGTPNSLAAHKIYEFEIPFSYIHSGPGLGIDFSSPLSGKHISMPYDGDSGRDNVWPASLQEFNIDTWGILYSQAHIEMCTIQIGVAQPNGTVLWLPGYAYPDLPPSQCPDKTGYYTDVLDRTIVIHQFNQTITY
jgi:hypothetical protein